MSDNMMSGKNRLVFKEKLRKPEFIAPLKPWKVVIADDESGIHDITKLALDDFTFEGRNLEFLSAFSGADTKAILHNNHDAAVILLDVVMETESIGLEVARYIREELNNRFIRIVLRTGQPGKAPAREVITGYDINDYKEKSRLDNKELFTTITSSLRAFRDLRTIEKNRRGLELIIKSSVNILEHQTFRNLASDALIKLLYILQLDNEVKNRELSCGFAACQEDEAYFIHTATGELKKYKNTYMHESLSGDVQKNLETAIACKESCFTDDAYIGYFATQKGMINLFYLDGCHNLTELDRDLIRIFSANLAIAFDNIDLYQENIETQKELILMLGETIETRSDVTANHVRRVAEISYILAIHAGLSIEDAELLRFASPMHDVGKVGINDSVLLKPGQLTERETEEIKIHTTKGYNILKVSDKAIMKIAATVAHEHHERWDGKGYPQGLKGEEISLFGRITAMADVFDALGHKRCYKSAWTRNEILDYMIQERGGLFDPSLVDVFLEHQDDFFQISTKYPDE
jgi:response regulator RpfG family c-di-GMP phosphodiesterase